MIGVTTKMINRATIPARDYGRAVAKSYYEDFIQRALVLKKDKGMKITFGLEKTAKVSQRVTALRQVLSSRNLLTTLQPMQRANSIYLIAR